MMPMIISTVTRKALPSRKQIKSSESLKRIPGVNDRQYEHSPELVKTNKISPRAIETIFNEKETT
jgi:hypothetical protein